MKQSRAISLAGAMLVEEAKAQGKSKAQAQSTQKTEAALPHIFSKSSRSNTLRSTSFALTAKTTSGFCAINFRERFTSGNSHQLSRLNSTN